MTSVFFLEWIDYDARWAVNIENGRAVFAHTIECYATREEAEIVSKTVRGDISIREVRISPPTEQ